MDHTQSDSSASDQLRQSSKVVELCGKPLVQNWAGEPAHLNNAYMSSNPVQPSLESEEAFSPEPLRKQNLHLSNAKLRRPCIAIGSSVKKATVFAYRETSAVKS